MMIEELLGITTTTAIYLWVFYDLWNLPSYNDGENLKDFIVDTVIHLITGGEVKKDTKLPVKRNNTN